MTELVTRLVATTPDLAELRRGVSGPVWDPG